jgi:Tfp pilus assembly protein FimV
VPSIADTHGWLLVEAGAVRDGLEILKTADAAQGAVQPDIRYHYAAALARSGERDQARQLLDDLVANGGEFSSRSEAAALLQSLGPKVAT